MLDQITSDENWLEVENYYNNKLALLYYEIENSSLTTEKLWELRGKAIAFRSILRLKATVKKLYNQGEE